MSDQSKPASSGMAFRTTLFFIVLILRLCKVITWSWWWVTAPLWMPTLITIFGILMMLIIWGLASIFGKGGRH